MHTNNLSPKCNPTRCQPTALECAQLAVCLATMPHCESFVLKAQATPGFMHWHPHALLWLAYTTALACAMRCAEDCADGSAAQTLPKCLAGYDADGLLDLLVA